MTWADESSALVDTDNFKGHIQQAMPQASEFIGEAWGKTFLVWCAKGTNVQAGDTLTIESGDYAGTYSVKNIQLNATGLNQHKELVVIKEIE